MIAFPLALIATFIALHRAGVAPRWAILFPIAALVVAFAEPFSTQASTATALGLMTIALAGVATRVFAGGPVAPQPAAT